MIETYSILQNILTLINEDLGLSFLCKAIKAYDTKNLPIPLEITYFTVSCEENKNTYYENDEAQQCMKNTVTIRLNCFAPLRRIPYMSHGICEIAVKFIADHYMPAVKSATVGETEYDSEVKAFKVPCTMVLEFISCPAENTQYSELSDASQYFCKDHISDPNIHLTAEDRTYLDSPCVTGTYTGDGVSDGKYITLGFRPTCVFVYRHAQHLTTYDPSSKISTCNFVLCARTTYIRGVVLTDTGFRVRTISSSGVITPMNDSGVAYTYIAFR